MKNCTFQKKTANVSQDPWVAFWAHITFSVVCSGTGTGTTNLWTKSDQKNKQKGIGSQVPNSTKTTIPKDTFLPFWFKNSWSNFTLPQHSCQVFEGIPPKVSSVLRIPDSFSGFPGGCQIRLTLTSMVPVKRGGSRGAVSWTWGCNGKKNGKTASRTTNQLVTH